MKLFLLAAVVAMSLAGCNSGGVAWHTQVQSDFAALTPAIQMYRLNGGRYPTTEQGLVALVTRPTTGPQPRRWKQLMSRVMLDPWGKPYQYRLISDSKPDTETFELRSGGKDGQDGTADDITSESPPPEPVNPE